MTYLLSAMLCSTFVGSAIASGYVERFGQQVAGSLDIQWELISGPAGAPIGCTEIEFTDGTLIDASDGTVTMSGIATSNGSCVGLDNYNFAMSPDGLSLTGFASAVPMTLTRMPGDPSFVGDWVASGYVFRAHIAADPFPVPDYDPTWLGKWAGKWIDENDAEFFGSVEMLVEESIQEGNASVLTGTLTWDCLFGDECGAVQQFTANVVVGLAEMDAVNFSDVENFTDGQYQITRSADGLSITAERLDDPQGREIRVQLHRVAAIAVPSESPSIQQAVDDFASRANALRLELTPGSYIEKIDLAAFSGRVPRTDVVGMGASPDETVIDDGVVGVNGSVFKTSGAGNNGLLVLDNFTVTGGESVDQEGAGLLIDGGSYNVVVKNCELRNNTITLVTPHLGLYAGANATLWEGGRARFDSCVFTEGAAASLNGGGLLVNRADVVVVDNLFQNNTASSGGAITLISEFIVGGGEHAYLLRNRFIGNTGTSTGGAVFVGSYSNTIIEESEFSDNVSVGSFATGGAINVVFPNSFTVRSSSFIRNETGRVGGAINLSGRGTHLIEDSTFGGEAGEGNKAGSAGGAIVIRSGYNYDYDVNIVNSSFNVNEAPFGGAIAVVETNLDFASRINVNASNINLINNLATTAGGAIYVERASADTGILTLDDCRVLANTAPVGGGLFHNVNGYTHVKDCLFQYNEATNLSAGGGGMWVQGSQIDLDGVEFLSNNGGFGAGVLLIESDASKIQNSRFGQSPDQGNVATSSGGALYVQSAGTNNREFAVDLMPGMSGEAVESQHLNLAMAGTVTEITNTVFEANTAINGGAVYLISNANAEINNSQFESNSADQGGAIFQSQSISKIQSLAPCLAYNFSQPDRYCSEFINNSSANGGSAIQFQGTNNSQIFTTSFLNNLGPSAIQLFESGTDLTLESVWLHENETDAIVTRGSSSLTATHVTLTENGGSGLVGLDQSSLFMFNSIAYSNVAGGVSSLGSGLSNTDCNFDQSGNVGSMTDPLLVTNYEGQSHLDTASPAVDACSELGMLDVDLEGRDRVFNFSPDAGAFELNDDIIFKNGFE